MMPLRLAALLIRRHLVARPSRTALTVIGIALGVAVGVAIRTANVDLLKRFDATVLSVAGEATLQVTGADDLGFDERLIQVIRTHPEVRSALPILHLTGTVLNMQPAGQVLSIVAFDLFEVAQKRLRMDARQGDGLDHLVSANAVFIGARLAAQWQLRPGDVVEVGIGGRRYALRVAALLDPEEGPASAWATMAVMDIAAAQHLFGLAGRLDRIDVVTEGHASVEAVREALQASLPAGMAVTRPAFRTEQVERMVKAFQLNLTVLSSVSLLVGLFLVYNAVSFAVVQRRREIGMLSAMGVSRVGIARVFLLEAAALGTIGGAVGTLGGLLLARTVMDRLGRTVTDLYAPVSQTAGPHSLLAFLWHASATPWLEGVLLGTLVSVFGALLPSRDAARTPVARVLAPGEYMATRAMGYTASVTSGAALLVLALILALPGPVMGLPLFGYGAALCLLVGLACLVPLCAHLFTAGLLHALPPVDGRGGRPIVLWARLAVEHLARAPGRVGVTVSAMMVGMAIMVGVGTMVGSFRDTVQVWLDQTIMADLIVAPSAWLQGHEAGQLAKRLPPHVAAELAAIDGVSAVDPYRDVTLQVHGRPVHLVSRDLALHAQRSRYLFTSGKSTTLIQEAITQDGVVISEVLARAVAVGPGQHLTLMTPRGPHGFPVIGVFYDYATDGGKIVMDRGLYRRWWGDETMTVLAVYAQTGADVQEIRRRVEATVGAADSSGDRVPLVVIANQELKRDVMTIFDRTFTITYGLELIAIVIAVLGIVNTLVTSVLHRRREFALLRSMGTAARDLRRLMLWESSYLGVLGVTLGVIAGLLLSVLLIAVINKQSFGWTIQFGVQPAIIVQSAAVGLVAVVVGGYVPARWAARQSMAEGLRYE